MPLVRLVWLDEKLEIAGNDQTLETPQFVEMQKIALENIGDLDFGELEPNLKASNDEPPKHSKHQLYWYQNDHLGTPRELTSHEGNIAWEAVYQAWGNTVAVEWQEVELQAIQLNEIEKSYLLQPHRFQGQIYDVETGLHYNRFRYYDPDIGRFISHDPIGLLGGDNHFQYAPNPVEWVDLFGLAKMSGSTGAYGKVGGHHVHAKAGFKNAPNFKDLANKMFSLGNDWMDENGINHSKITQCQRRKFKELEALGCSKNTMKKHTKIAVECLMEGGADEKTARSLVAKSLNELRKMKVTKPNHVPWSK